VRALYCIVRYNLFSRWGAKISDERYGQQRGKTI
jgi:hypothetical protein